MLSFLELTNFGIFKERTFIDFKKTKYTSLEDTNTRNNLIKTALFYGPNGSGKTTILKSVALLIEMLTLNIPFNADFICNFSKQKISTLKYGFLINGHNIIYSFSVNINGDIKEEKLILDDKEIFSRIGTSATTTLINNNESQEVDSKILFLKILKFSYGLKSIEVLDEWYNFLKNSIIINESSKIFRYSREIEKDSNFAVFFNNNGQHKINDFFKNEGIPYTIITKEVNILNSKQMFVFLKNDIIGNEIELNKESYGNIILITYLVNILAVNKNGGMILFDEFGGGLHNKLNELLLRYLNKNIENAQTFISTHETNLLKTSLTRPDQVYLVEYNKNGAYIKRASEENPREAQNLEKMYLAGVFGGVPSYDKN